MDLRLQANFDQRLSGVAFSSLSVDHPTSQQRPPCIVLDTLSLIIASICEKQNLIITTPSKESFGQVVAALLAMDDQLRLVDEDRLFIGPGSAAFTPGDKLKMGNAIVEYVRADVDTGGVVIRYNPKNPLIHTLTRQESLVLQRTDSGRRLSPTKKFNEERRKLRNSSDWAASLHRGITFATSSVIIVGPLKRSRDFFRNTLINEMPLNTLVLCAQITYDKNDKAVYETIGKGQYTGTPALVSAMDLYDVLQLDEDKLRSVKAIVIDVDNYQAFVRSNISELRKLQQLKLPMYVIVSNASVETVDLLREEGFLKWCWDSRTLERSESTEDVHPRNLDERIPFFHNLNLRCKYCTDGSIQLTTVSDARLDNLYNLLEGIDGCFGTESANEIAADTRAALWRIFIKLLRTQAPFSFESSDILRAISELRAPLMGQQGFISTKLLDFFYRSFLLITEIASSEYNEKQRAIYHGIRDMAYNGSVTLVVNSPIEAEVSTRYWSQFMADFGTTKLTVLPYAALKAMRTPLVGRVIVVGWLGKEKMTSLLNGSTAEIVNLVLYEGCETGWYLSRTNAWKKYALDTDDSNRVLRETHAIFNGTLPALPKPLTVAHNHTDTVIDNAEDLWRQRTYSKHEAKGEERESSVQAIPVRFAGDFIAFYRENAYLTDVTDIIEGGSKLAKAQRVGDSEGLAVGSFVLIKEADRDLIEQLADELMGDAAPQLRSTASAWRDGLRRLYELWHYDDRSVYNALSVRGMSKGLQAFRSLRDDSNKIAPGRNLTEIVETVRAIGRALHDEQLVDRAEEIAQAGVEIQTRHRLAGRQLSSTLAEAFMSYMVESDLSKPEDIWSPVDLIIDGIGAVKLCRILAIDRDHVLRVPDWKTGKLYEE